MITIDGVSKSYHNKNKSVKALKKISLHIPKGEIVGVLGISGSGKTTVAKAVERRLYELGHIAYVLDGDNIRHGLNSNLTFSDEDRKENIRRISEIAKLFADAGVITLTAFISPFREDRKRARKIIENESFGEVYISTSIEECEKRDVKGLYKKARDGEIKNFTGIDSPYEPPENAEVTVDTTGKSIEESAEEIINYLKSRKVLQGE